MRYILYILIIFIFACDGVEETGLPEYEGVFNYYDYVAYGWAEFLNEQYDNSISFFQQALLIDDVNEDETADYMHHSAYVGISWAKTYLANELLLTDNSSEIDQLRDDAFNYLCYFKGGDTWFLSECDGNESEIESSDLDAWNFYSISDEDITTCVGEYCCSECFIKDKQVAMLYYYAYKYHKYFYEDDIANANLAYDEVISYGLNFLSSTQSPGLLDKNQDYNFMNGKPLESPVFNMKYRNLIILMGQLYLKNGDYDNAALILADICEGVSSLEIQTIIDCVNSF